MVQIALLEEDTDCANHRRYRKPYSQTVQINLLSGGTDSPTHILPYSQEIHMVLLTDSRDSPTHILRYSQTVQKALQKAGWILSSGCSDCASSFPSSSSSSPSLPSESCSLGTLFLQGIRGPDDFQPTHGQLVPSVQGIRGPSDFSSPHGQLVPSVSLLLCEHL